MGVGVAWGAHGNTAWGHEEETEARHSVGGCLLLALLSPSSTSLHPPPPILHLSPLSPKPNAMNSCRAGTSTSLTRVRESPSPSTTSEWDGFAASRATRASCSAFSSALAMPSAEVLLTPAFACPTCERDPYRADVLAGNGAFGGAGSCPTLGSFYASSGGNAAKVAGARVPLCGLPLDSGCDQRRAARPWRRQGIISTLWTRACGHGESRIMAPSLFVCES